MCATSSISSTHPLDVDELFRSVPLTDGHNDFAWMIRGWLQNRLDPSSAEDLENMPIGQTDIQRLKKSRVGCQFWSAFVPCPSPPSSSSNVLVDDFAPTAFLLDTLRTTLQQIDLLHNMFHLHPQVFGFVQTSKEVLPTFHSGRIASFLGLEGLHQIANSASVLRMFHRLGVRYATLCHDSNNLYVDSATSKTAAHNGLSSAGHDMIHEMNRIGMMVDVSHTSHEAQRQVLAHSKTPVIFSHSSCFTLCPHPRNVTDDVLDMLKHNGGIIMICFLPSLLDPSGGREATIDQVVDHIMYAGNRIGFSHVGIGSDFDGMLKGPRDLDDVTQYPELVSKLADRGLGREALCQVLGLNMIRVLGDVEDTAKQLQKDGATILFDDVSPIWTEEQRAILRRAGSVRRGRVE